MEELKSHPDLFQQLNSVKELLYSFDSHRIESKIPVLFQSPDRKITYAVWLKEIKNEEGQLTGQMLTLSRCSYLIEFFEEKTLLLPKGPNWAICNNFQNYCPNSTPLEIFLKLEDPKDEICCYLYVNLNDFKKFHYVSDKGSNKSFELLTNFANSALFSTQDQKVIQLKKNGSSKIFLNKKVVNEAIPITNQLLHLKSDNIQNSLFKTRTKKIILRPQIPRIKFFRICFLSRKSAIYMFQIISNRKVQVKVITGDIGEKKYEFDLKGSFFTNKIELQQDPHNQNIIYFITINIQSSKFFFWPFDLSKLRLLAPKKINLPNNIEQGTLIYVYDILGMVRGAGQDTNAIMSYDDGFFVLNVTKEKVVRKKSILKFAVNGLSLNHEASLLYFLTDDYVILIADAKTLQIFKCCNLNKILGFDLKVRSEALDLNDEIAPYSILFIQRKKIFVKYGKILAKIDLENLKLEKKVWLEDSIHSSQKCYIKGDEKLLLEFKKSKNKIFIVDFELEMYQWDEKNIPAELSHYKIHRFLYREDSEFLLVIFNHEESGILDFDFDIYAYFSGSRFQKFEGFHIRSNKFSIGYRLIKNSRKFLIFDTCENKIGTECLTKNFNCDWKNLLEEQEKKLKNNDEINEWVFISSLKTGEFLFASWSQRCIIKFDPENYLIIATCYVQELGALSLSDKKVFKDKEFVLVFGERLVVRINLENMEIIEKRDILEETLQSQKSLREVAMNLCYFSAYKDWIKEKVDIWRLLALENEVEALKLVLEVFGYPRFSPELAKNKDPYLLTKNLKFVKEEIIEILKKEFEMLTMDDPQENNLN